MFFFISIKEDNETITEVTKMLTSPNNYLQRKYIRRIYHQEDFII